MKTRRTLLLTLCAGVAACSPSPSPVPVVAEAGELLQLAGEWQGHYDSPVVGRSGSIVFELEAGRDTAYGEVTMIPAGWTRPLGPADDPAAVARGAPAPETLRIRFIRVEYGVISGTMQPYDDPDCGCPVYTTFIGQLGGDLIEGEFTARPGHGPPYKGTWQVQRKRY